MTYDKLMDALQKGVDKPYAILVGKFPIKALSLSRKAVSQTMIDIRHGEPSFTIGPVEVMYNIETGQFIVTDGYHRIVDLISKKKEFAPVKIWSTSYSDYYSDVREDDLFFDPVPLNSFPSLKKEIVSKKGLKKILKEIVNQILKEERDLPYGGWLDPQLKFHKVYYQQHENWAENYLSFVGDANPEESVYKKMYKLGFIRIVFDEYDDFILRYKYGHEYDDKGVRQYVEPPSPQKIKSLKDLAIEYGCKYIQDDVTDKATELLQEIRLEPPVDVTVKESSTGRKINALRILKYLPQMTDDTIYVTINKMVDKPTASFIQVDGVINSVSVFSSQPKQIMKLGYPMPKLEQLWRLPAGKYKLSDIKNLLKKKASVTETMTYEKLLSLTAKTPRSPEDDTNRIDRSKTVNVRSIPVSVEEGLEQWNFRYKSSPQTTVTDEPFEGHITFLKGKVGSNDNAIKLECKVDCGCRDYKYKFAHNNYSQGAGDIGGDSLNKCINRSPKSSTNIGEGLCKHLVSLGKYLKTKISATKKSNLFEAVSDVAKQGPFNITYND